jgi:hypothetical protein
MVLSSSCFAEGPGDPHFFLLIFSARDNFASFFFPFADFSGIYQKIHMPINGGHEEPGRR